jgi:hypothetical protein
MNPIADLLATKSAILAYHTLMKGEFEKEIARLEALNKEINSKLGKIKTLKDAEEAAAVIKAEAAKLLEEANAEAKKVAAAVKAVKVREAEADVKANDARVLELEVHDKWNHLRREQELHSDHVLKVQNFHDQQQADLNASAAAVAKQQEEVNAKAAKITEALR